MTRTIEILLDIVLPAVVVAALALMLSEVSQAGECLSLHQARHAHPARHLWWADRHGHRCWFVRGEGHRHEAKRREGAPPSTQALAAPPAAPAGRRVEYLGRPAGLPPRVLAWVDPEPPVNAAADGRWPAASFEDRFAAAMEPAFRIRRARRVIAEFARWLP